MSDAIDLGADGLAAQARAWVERPIHAPGASYSREARVWVRQYRDECVIDTLNSRSDQWRLSDRQWRAGCLFRGKWLATRHANPTTAGYGERVAGRGTADMLGYSSDCRAALDALCEHMPEPEWMAVCAVAGEDERAKGRWHLLVRGLDRAADWWDVPGDYRRWVHIRRRPIT